MSPLSKAEKQHHFEVSQLSRGKMCNSVRICPEKIE